MMSIGGPFLGIDTLDAPKGTRVARSVGPWGIRTASFQDPDGYIWEIAH